jgi:hypothetical protein
MNNKGFENKVAELVAITHQLEVPQILMLRRMTLVDPQSLKWANQRQLELIFNVILGKALERTGVERVAAAANQHFDPLLPPGSEDANDKDRWMLFDLAKPMLAGATPSQTETALAVMDELEAESEDEATESGIDFPTVFDNTMIRYIRRILSVLTVTGTRPHIPPPFLLAPGFAACYERVMREMLLPTMRSSRRLRELASTRNWAEDGAGDRLIGMVQSADISNPVLHQWNTRWEAFHPEKVLKGKDGKVRPRKPEDDPWPLFTEDAAKHAYMPPCPSDIPLLALVLKLEPESLADAWHSLAQIYEQEFSPKTRADQARAGAFRDSLLKTIEKLDHHAGDLLTIKAFFDYSRVDRLFLKQLIMTLGRSDAERFRKAPVLINFYNDLPK